MNTLASHTPGPWEVNTTAGRPFTEVFAGNAILVADTIGQHHIPEFGVPADQAEANAYLIAAAPDMLEALLSALAELMSGADHAAIDKIRAAIAKADGVN